MGLIKDIYSPLFYEKLADSLAVIIPGFNKLQFIQDFLTADFKAMEWKQRMKHTTKVVHQFLPADYPQAVIMLEDIINQLRYDGFGEDKLEFMFFPDYIETYGLQDFENSVKALAFITQFVSCEFAVRPFILQYGEQMIAQMTAWSLHENYKVRRLASEGTRPRLPWAMAIPELKKNPAPIIPLLENLKNDSSAWVRRSVANNLNDIAKDHPEVLLAIATKWKEISPETDAIIKHGCRTLLKQGHPKILTHFGLHSNCIEFTDFKILTPEVKVGHNLEFSFCINNNQATTQLVRLEYAIYYQKQSGRLSKKVFKISERIYEPHEKAVVKRKQSFKPITTRKFYLGQHGVSVIVNGEEKVVNYFELLD